MAASESKNPVISEGVEVGALVHAYCGAADDYQHGHVVSLSEHGAFIRTEDGKLFGVEWSRLQVEALQDRRTGDGMAALRRTPVAADDDGEDVVLRNTGEIADGCRVADGDGDGEPKGSMIQGVAVSPGMRVQVCPEADGIVHGVVLSIHHDGVVVKSDDTGKTVFEEWEYVRILPLQGPDGNTSQDATDASNHDDDGEPKETALLLGVVPPIGMRVHALRGNTYVKGVVVALGEDGVLVKPEDGGDEFVSPWGVVNVKAVRTGPMIHTVSAGEVKFPQPDKGRALEKDDDESKPEQDKKALEHTLAEFIKASSAEFDEAEMRKRSAGLDEAEPAKKTEQATASPQSIQVGSEVFIRVDGVGRAGTVVSTCEYGAFVAEVIGSLRCVYGAGWDNISLQSDPVPSDDELNATGEPKQTGCIVNAEKFEASVDGLLQATSYESDEPKDLREAALDAVAHQILSGLEGGCLTTAQARVGAVALGKLRGDAAFVDADDEVDEDDEPHPMPVLFNTDNPQLPDDLRNLLAGDAKPDPGLAYCKGQLSIIANAIDRALPEIEEGLSEHTVFRAYEFAGAVLWHAWQWDAKTWRKMLEAGRQRGLLERKYLRDPHACNLRQQINVLLEGIDDADVLETLHGELQEQKAKKTEQVTTTVPQEIDADGNGEQDIDDRLLALACVVHADDLADLCSAAENFDEHRQGQADTLEEMRLNLSSLLHKPVDAHESVAAELDARELRGLILDNLAGRDVDYLTKMVEDLKKEQAYEAATLVAETA